MADVTASETESENILLVCGQEAYTSRDTCPIQVMLEVKRGPIKFAYAPVTVGFRTICDPDQTREVTITPNFITPCSRVEWAGTLGDEERFVVNVNTRANGDVAGKPNQVEVTLRNPDYALRAWRDDSRLRSVELVYRRVGGITWTTAVSVARLPLQFPESEDDYGYATQFWDVSTVPDGRYEIEARTECTVASDVAAHGINGMHTMPIRGWMDRRGPRLFGREVHPADELHSAEDPISATFDEELDCGLPYTFTVTMKIGWIIFHTNEIPVFCEGRTIHLELPPTLPLTKVFGQRINVTISGVRDVAGNVAEASTNWVFLGNRPSLDKAKAVIEGLKLRMPWNDNLGNPTSPAFVNLTTAISTEMINFTKVCCI